MVFSFYAPDLDLSGSSVLDPNTGDDATAIDDAKAQANFTPLDPRDPPTLIVSDVTPNDHTLTLKSLAVQKNVTIATDTGAPVATPGDTLLYTLSFQVSDYFAFQNIILDDLFSDGLEYVQGSATLQATDGHSPLGTTSGAFDPANVALSPNISGGSDALAFNVSDELFQRGFSLNGRLLGGAIPAGGGTPVTGPNPPFGPTTGTITFLVTIQDRYEVDFPAGSDPNVKPGDTLTNSVTTSGDVLNNVTLDPTGSSEEDNSSTSVPINPGTFTKTVYAVNGVVAPDPVAGYPGSVGVSPGDTVTYRLRLTLPSGDAGNLALTDYLPLPIFDVDAGGRVTAFVQTVSAAAPAAGLAQYAPDTTAFVAGFVPTILNDSSANSVVFTFGTLDNPQNTFQDHRSPVHRDRRTRAVRRCPAAGPTWARPTPRTPTATRFPPAASPRSPAAGAGPDASRRASSPRTIPPASSRRRRSVR